MRISRSHVDGARVIVELGAGLYVENAMSLFVITYKPTAPPVPKPPKDGDGAPK